MGIFDKFIVRPKTENTSDAGRVVNVNFNGFSKSNKDIALKISALYCGLNLISETISSLPVYKYIISEDGSKVRCKEKINYLLNRSCNGFISAFDMKDALIKSAILEGNGFVLIVRDEYFNITKLVPLKKSECELRRINGTDEYLYYVPR